MNRNVVLALLILSVAAIACGSSTPELKTVDDYVREYGGNADVYQRILTSTDCTQLQRDFDQAYENLSLHEPGTKQYKWGLGYMDAADKRMEDINCYDTSKSSMVNTPVATRAVTQITIENSPTSFILPTLTPPGGRVIYISPTPLPTNTIIFHSPTRAPTRVGGNPPLQLRVDCSCAMDTLNCENFSTWYDAQSCMDYCVGIGRGDIYNLDADADGIACESLP